MRRSLESNVKRIAWTKNHPPPAEPIDLIELVVPSCIAFLLGLYAGALFLMVVQ